MVVNHFTQVPVSSPPRGRDEIEDLLCDSQGHAVAMEESRDSSFPDLCAGMTSSRELFTKQNPVRLALVVATVLLVAIGTCAMCTPGWRGGPPAKSYPVSGYVMLAAEKCAGSGENCFDAKCCKGKGLQCYLKSDGWAACKQQCIEGPDPYDVNDASWSCKMLGNRTPGIPDEPIGQVADWVKKKCTKTGGNCHKTKCCSHGGVQCFEKNKFWAGCKASCLPGPDLTDANNGIWTCKELGFKTPGTPPPLAATVAKWVKSKCSKSPGSNDNCIKTQCCRDEGMQCYKKTDHWASCKPSCVPGPDLQDGDNAFWNCSTLGSRTPGKIPKEENWVSKWVKTECTGDAASCLISHCCTGEGMQCYQKNKGWAACQAKCAPGPDIFDENKEWWSCKVLGPRTPGNIPTVNQAVASWVKSECAGDGEDCSKTQCCKDAGMQCYQKAPGWAACKASCLPGPDLYDADMKPWSCRTLGPRTPGEHVEPKRKISAWVKSKCSEPGQDCSHTQCCKGDGMQCFQKQIGWATCKTGCAPGSIDPNDPRKEPWNCNTLGPRTPGLASCVENGEDCRYSHCCKGVGMQCYEKDVNWASCKSSCKTGEKDGTWSCKKLGERANFGKALACTWAGKDCGLSKICCQEGLKCISKNEHYAGCLPGPRPGWANTVLGGSRVTCGKGKNATSCSNLVKPAAKGSEAKTLFFCFMAVLAGSVEEKLQNAMKSHNAGIFACDKNYVVPAQKAEFKHEGSWNSVANTAAFLKVWDVVLKNDQWMTCDWTIKVDPDTVFFPDRLRHHIWTLRPPANTPIYLKNTNMYNGFLGPIEVFSTDAVKLYHDYGKGCAKDMAEKGGEDGFFKLCMDSIGVGYMLDPMILSNRGYPKFCTDKFTSFHPFKTVDAWIACKDIATGKVKWGPAMDLKFGTEKPKILKKILK